MYRHMSKDAALQSNITKKMLAASLKKLMSEKPLHAITVKEITEKCGLHRQTFYYHFEDVHDLVRWMYEEDAFDLLMRSEEVFCWQDKILQLFGYISANREMCVCTLNSLSRETLKDFFSADLERVVRDVVLTYGRDLPRSEGYVEYLTHFYTVAFAGIVESWILGEIDLTPEMIVAYMEKTVKDQLNGAVMRYEKGRETDSGQGEGEQMIADNPLGEKPADYSDAKISVSFTVGDQQSAKEIVKGLGFAGEITEIKNGFVVLIAAQQIPEIVRALDKENIAVYGIVPQI
ncbi:transcriptional regulator, TetR family [Methanocorpusculum labreanum Z]|uniref:Transcriptional regulator, TetR family n=2 Tax=Methanocorpusculum labreanum TaxID=83984 RepID=A2SU65_METLZ|nr:transcriptional regulator, TetR family [Methanocorpusculum labreanum Z]